MRPVDNTDNDRDTERIAALKKYDILDTPPDAGFDHITRLAATLLNMPIAAVTIVDADRIWFKSQYGIDVQQIMREPGLCASAIQQDDLYLVEDAIIDQRCNSNGLVTGEFALRSYAAIPLRVNGGFILGTLCVMDVAPRSFNEEQQQVLKSLGEILVDQLELRLAARQANTRQNELLSMVAHELKNPLTTIPVYADLIKEQVADRENVAHMCGQIRKASERMNLLIGDLLETVRLQVHEIHLKKKQFDIAGLVARIASINIVLANSKKQRIFLDVNDNVDVFGDEARIAEIIDNLVSNAIKYSPFGAEIMVSLHNRAEMAVIQVQDQGPGFTKDDLRRLFQPFTRLSALPTGGENSTGVGLSIVKALVEAHGGSVRAENNNCAPGAKMIVELPAISELVEPLGISPGISMS